MDWKKMIGYGVVIYIVMFIYWSLLVALGAGEAAWGWWLAYVVLAATTHFVASKLGTKDCKELAKYAVAWLVVILALDALITVRFTGWEIFGMWQAWVIYGVLFFTPFSVKFCKGKCCKAKTVKEAQVESQSK